MRKSIVLVALLLIMILPLALANPDIIVSISVKDQDGREISGGKVLIGTIVFPSGHYEDPTHKLKATAKLSVWFNEELEAILSQSSIESGTTVTGNFTLTKLGTYKFKWEVESRFDEATVSTTVFVIPESPIGTLLGILAPLATLVSIATFKRYKMPSNH